MPSFLVSNNSKEVNSTGSEPSEETVKVFNIPVLFSRLYANTKVSLSSFASENSPQLFVSCSISSTFEIVLPSEETSRVDNHASYPESLYAIK